MRKTNLFYLDDNNSNFLTFSNYGEFLTGVCLSTNHKIWMSSFLCLNLPFTQENETEININNNPQNYNDSIGEFDNITFTRKHTVQNFKKFLMCYYENKLAYLRDFYESNNEKIENINVNNNLLNYLLDAIQLFFNLETPIESTIEYFGDIIEHDYNGTYNDSMCIVDFNRKKEIELSYGQSYNYCDNFYPLHNWNYELWNSNNLEDLENDIIKYHEICDISNDNNDSKYQKIPYIYFNESNVHNNDINKISFNCIIPLFDVINSNIDENADNIDEIDNIESNIYKNIPYGIWFASENEDGTLNNIELYKQDDNISQSWSLVICSKFAPYPYGVKINDESDDVLKSVEKYTYAELLAKNSQLLENYNILSDQYNKLNLKINELTKEINNLKLLNSNGLNIYDICSHELINIESRLEDKYKILSENFDSFVNQMKWKSINKSN